jgi:hypothetical protein
MERIAAPDGVDIVVHSSGTGPGFLAVHGGGVTIPRSGHHAINRARPELVGVLATFFAPA